MDYPSPTDNSSLVKIRSPEDELWSKIGLLIRLLDG